MWCGRKIYKWNICAAFVLISINLFKHDHNFLPQIKRFPGCDYSKILVNFGTFKEFILGNVSDSEERIIQLPKLKVRVLLETEFCIPFDTILLVRRTFFIMDGTFFLNYIITFVYQTLTI